MKIKKYFALGLVLVAAAAAHAQTRSAVRANKPVSADERDLRSILKQGPTREVPPRQLSEDERHQLRQQLSQGRRDSRRR